MGSTNAPSDSGKRRRMKMLVLLLASFLCLCRSSAGQDQDSAVGLNLAKFLPLEVGNQWTFVHSYRNQMYPIWDYFFSEDWTEEQAAYWAMYFKQYEIPGYPLGSQPPPISHPPESLTHPQMVEVNVEITHTERINGFEYFVFSPPSYSWPPFPHLFWTEKKVRLSDDGILLVSINGSDIPLYDFRMPSVKTYGYDLNDTGQFGPTGGTRWMKDQLTYPIFSAHLEISVNQAYRDQVLEMKFVLYPDVDLPAVLYGPWEVFFVNGYGLGSFTQLGEDPLNYEPLFFNDFYPISALLSGKEVSFEEAVRELLVVKEPDFPPIVGKRDTLRYLQKFDFSEGISVKSFFSETPHHDMALEHRTDSIGFSEGPIYLTSPMGIRDLGPLNFAEQVSEGSPSLTKSSDYWRVIEEGSTYAVWTEEGGVALVHILDIVRFRRGAAVIYILFDWVYYPPSDNSDKTAIQPTSWGELKILISGG